MARALTSIPQTDTPNAEYPSGRIRNEDSPIVGTPIIEELYGDIIQFFHKLVRLAGLTLNGLPDSETNTFQLIQALQAYIRSISGSLTEKGVWQSASNAETQAGAINTKVVTPSALESKQASLTQRGLVFKANDAMIDAANDIDPASNVLYVPPSQLNRVLAGLHAKLLNIGTWNMDSTPLKSVAHGLTFAKIRSAKAFIYPDDLSYCKDLLSGDQTAFPGSVSWDGTNVNLYRGQLFDTTDFDTLSNRGFIIVEYII